jgi:hypothetical protein
MAGYENRTALAHGLSIELQPNEGPPDTVPSAKCEPSQTGNPMNLGLGKFSKRSVFRAVQLYVLKIVGFVKYDKDYISIHIYINTYHATVTMLQARTCQYEYYNYLYHYDNYHYEFSIGIVHKMSDYTVSI